MNDDRMDDRLKKEQGVARRARAMDDRQVTENRAVTDREPVSGFHEGSSLRRSVARRKQARRNR